MKDILTNQTVTMTLRAPAPSPPDEASGESDSLSIDVEVADRSLTRTIGLLGRDSIEERHAMFIKNCRSIHTFFMRFSIDVAFVNDQFCIVDLAEKLPPGRLFICRDRTGRHVLEFKGGFLEKNKVKKGSRWLFDHQV